MMNYHLLNYTGFKPVRERNETDVLKILLHGFSGFITMNSKE